MQEFANFVKKILTLEGKTEKNTAEIKILREDLVALTRFTQKVAAVVKENRARIKHNEEQRGSEREIIVLQLENELFKLEKRLSEIYSTPSDALNPIFQETQIGADSADLNIFESAYDKVKSKSSQDEAEN